MRQQGLDRIAGATTALYLREIGRIRSILAEENTLRGRLAKLDAAAAEARQTLAGDTGLRRVGADILWQGWESRTRRQLNIELAQVRARKLAAMDKVRRAFGRQRAVQAMADARIAQLRAARDRLWENRLLDQILPVPD